MPLICERHNRNPKGAVVLTSPSRDGAILEEFMKHFGVPSVRGSSSRRGATALLELTKYLEEGKDVVITPDGPRGPRYRLGQGLIFLAQKADCPIMPIHVGPSRCVRLRGWDGFMIPLPFTRADITFKPLFWARRSKSEGEFEEDRSALEQILQPKEI